MKAYVFPGQGSQKKGMGAELFDEFPDITGKADEILGYSVKELCLKDPEMRLNLTEFTQPALYTVNALAFAKEIRGEGEAQVYYAGHSLGEYNALCAAGVFDFETGLRLVKKRGELMGLVKDGGMAAILNLSADRIREILLEGGFSALDIANHNSPAQTVISGRKEDLAGAQALLQAAKGVFIPLNTSAAFHSRFMREAQEGFEVFAKGFAFSAPKMPVIANVTAKPYETGEILQSLVRQISSCVQWTDTIGYMLAQGVEEFREVGPGDVLTKLIGRIRKDWKAPVAPVAPVVQMAPAASERNQPTETSVPPMGQSEAPSAQSLVDQWNEVHAVGTKVTCKSYEEELVTRTAAIVLFGHRAAVYMEGFNGYFDLRELEPANASLVS